MEKIYLAARRQAHRRLSLISILNIEEGARKEWRNKDKK